MEKSTPPKPVPKVNPLNIARDAGRELDHFLICIICSNILESPKECSTCQNSFCSDCLDTWLQEKTQCPFQCKFSSFQPSHRFVRQALESLLVVCQSEGCEEKVRYEDYVSHLAHCPFAKLRCVYCEIEIARKDYRTHLNECPEGIIDCAGCQERIQRKE